MPIALGCYITQSNIHRKSSGWFTVLFVSSPTDLHYNSLHVPSVCCAPSTALHSTHNWLPSNTLYLYILLYSFNRGFSWTCRIFFNCGLIPTHYNGSCILVSAAEWTDHVGGYRTVDLDSYTQVHLLAFLKIYLINTRNKGHIKMVWRWHDSKHGVRRTWQ